MDVPTLVAEIRHQLGFAPIRFRGVIQVILPRECFAPGRPPVRLTPERIYDFRLCRAKSVRFPLRLPLVVPREQMADFCWTVESALGRSLIDEPLWIVRDLPLDLKTEGRIVARTVPAPVAFLVDAARMRAHARHWSVSKLDFGLVHIAAVNRKLVPEILDDWEEREPRWVELDPDGLAILNT